MAKIATSIEQSKALLELRIDRSTADMYWWYAEGKNYLYVGEPKDDNAIPAWSLSALMSIIPITANLTKCLEVGKAVYRLENFFINTYKKFDNPIDAIMDMLPHILSLPDFNIEKVREIYKRQRKLDFELQKTVINLIQKERGFKARNERVIMKDSIKKIVYLAFAAIFLLLAIYQTLKGLAMIYEPLYYIGLGVVNYYLANTAMHIYDKIDNK